LQRALGPSLAALESLSEQIRAYNEQIEKLAQESCPPTPRQVCMGDCLPRNVIRGQGKNDISDDTLKATGFTGV
jgi:hypothetical protein